MKQFDALDIEIDAKATGENIRRLIQESGYSVVQIMEMLHMGCVQSIYKWMYGSLPNIDNLVCLAKLLDVAVEEILVLKEKE